MGNTIFGGNGNQEGYQIQNSCMFNGANQYMTHTRGTATNEKKFTFSSWVKLGNTGHGANGTLFGSGDDGNGYVGDALIIQTNGLTKQGDHDGSTDNHNVRTSALLHDVSAWYHIVCACDSTQGTAANRIKLYINGTQQTTLAATTYPSQNITFDCNTNGQVLNIGRNQNGEGHVYFSGYLAETVFIDGQQLAPSSFAETDDNGIWIPKDISSQGLTFGNNGFYFQYQQTGTSANASGIGADTSGETNHFAVNNLGANSPALDVPTNSFCTMIPANNMTLTLGNLSGATTRTGNWDAVQGSMGVTTGKWYFECRASRTEDNFRVIVGVVGDPENWTIGFNAKGTTGDPLSTFSNTYPFYGKGVWLSHWYDEDYNDSSTASTQSNNDIIQIALDMDNYKVWVGINGQFKDNSNNNVSYADVAAGNSATVTIASAAYTGKTFFPAFWLRDDQDQDDNLADINFGGSISFNISSAVADTAGRGKFEYTVPSGYYALCTKNLAAVG